MTGRENLDLCPRSIIRPGASACHLTKVRCAGSAPNTDCDVARPANARFGAEVAHRGGANRRLNRGYRPNFRQLPGFAPPRTVTLARPELRRSAVPRYLRSR